VGTKVTAKGLEQLKELKKLQKIFLYQTLITGNEWGNLKKIFPRTILDSGGYKVQTLASDTIEVKPPKTN
jgi:hypothetical protein